MTRETLRTTDIMDAIREVGADRNWCSDAEAYIAQFLKLECLDRDSCWCFACTGERALPRFTLKDGQAKTMRASKFRIAIESTKRAGALPIEDLNQVGRRVLGDDWTDFAQEYRVSMVISIESVDPDGPTVEDMRAALDAGAFRDLDVYAI